MKPFAVIIGSLAAVAALGGALWLLPAGLTQHAKPDLPISMAAAAKKATSDPTVPKEKRIDERPRIAEQGPHPKVVTEETDFEFGVMEIGQEGSHEFVVRNDGEADLVLGRGATTCKCTLSQVAEKPIPPGQSATVKLTWKPTADQTSIRQTAEIYTNDPKRPTFSLVISGKLQERLRLIPTKAWPVNDVLEGVPSHSTGYIVSSIVDAFNITAIEPSSPLVKVTQRELNDEEKKTHTARLGYAFDLEVDPTVPVGTFLYQVTIKTDLPGPPDSEGKAGEPVSYVVDITGNRPGPLQLIGPGFRSEQMTMSLGNFDASKGVSRSLNLFAQKCPDEGMKILELECQPPELKVTLTANPANPGQKTRRHMLTFEYPAGSPRIQLRKEDKPGFVKMKTNHPDIPEIRLDIVMTAY